MCGVSCWQMIYVLEIKYKNGVCFPVFASWPIMEVVCIG
jgi:hypothetical protein